MSSYRGDRAARWKVNGYQGFHERVLDEGSTPNGTFATKLHAAQLMSLTSEVLDRARPTMTERAVAMAELFPNPIYVWLRRRDPVAQAVSWVKACQTARWWDADVAPAPMRAAAPEAARFDYQHLERSMFALQKWDGVWRSYFAATGISPLEVWYEDLVADRAGTVQRVLDRLGVSTAAAAEPRPTTFRRQADETSATWARRFTGILAAKREGTYASLAGLHTGEPIHVCTGRRTEIGRDAITISVDGAPSPQPATYALYTYTPGRRPISGVVVTTVTDAIEHPFVVQMQMDGTPSRREQGLAQPPHAAAIDYAVGLAKHLGAATIHVS